MDQHRALQGHGVWDVQQIPWVVVDILVEAVRQCEQLEGLLFGSDLPTLNITFFSGKLGSAIQAYTMKWHIVCCVVSTKKASLGRPSMKSRTRYLRRIISAKRLAA